MAEPRQSRRLLAVALALYGCFWATAWVADGFLDKPFYYLPRAMWVSDLAASATRWLPASESLLTAAALVFLLPAIATAAVYFARRHDRDPLERWFERDDAERTVVVIAVALAVAVALFVSRGLVQGAAILDDERAYVFQANLFAHGHVGLPTPPHALSNPLILLWPMWTSGYPPGHSLVLAPAALIHAEHFVPPLLAGVLVVAVWSFARDMFGPRHGALAALLAGMSPFVWAVQGTMLAIATSVTCLAVFLAAIGRTERTGRARWMLLAGAAIGLAFITRPYEAVAFSVTFALRLVWEARSQPRRLAWAVLGFAAIAWILLAHDKLVTGSFVQLPWTLPTMPGFKLGFTRSMDYGQLVHSPLQAIGDLVAVIQRLDLWVLAWPGSLALVVAGAVRGRASRGDVMLRAALAGYLVCYLFVPYAGTWDVGPTYYYALVPLLVPLAVRGVSGLRAWLAAHATTFAPAAVARRAVGWGVLAGLVVAATAIAPMRADYIGSLAAEIRAPWEAIEHADLGPAIVIVPPAAQRHAPGWAFGYPYTLTSARGATVQLIAPADQHDLEQAVAFLGPKPIYMLVLDKDYYTATGTRRFTLAPLGPAKPQAPE